MDLFDVTNSYHLIMCWMTRLLITISAFYCFGCSSQTVSKDEVKNEIVVDTVYIEHTEYSTSKVDSTHFSPALAINRIADIENEYFKNFQNGYSKYYGAQWLNDMRSIEYLEMMDSLGVETDSLHCTMYAMEALKSGFGDMFDSLDTFHREIWKEREYAGWSIGYLLVKKFGWKAYLVIDSNSVEYERCLKSYKMNSTYPVWHQPKIPLEDIVVIGMNDSIIDKVLESNEFGWGFSYQGYHTWITRYDDLLECNWNGCPSRKYTDSDQGDLFKKTPFKDYWDYDSHVIVVPPKRED